MNFLLAGLKGVCRHMPGTNINFPREEKLEKKKKEEDCFIAGDPKKKWVQLMRNTSSQSVGTCRFNFGNGGGHMKQLFGMLCYSWRV